uniref:Uncharacterized protein n=1 Tax=Rhodococcus sp. NS1 TaxID=402236 RepID=A0A097SQA2_9NOCA|nr:hypothetical protein LRS1606.274 [Rhodococcus sp. NS1]
MLVVMAVMSSVPAAIVDVVHVVTMGHRYVSATLSVDMAVVVVRPMLRGRLALVEMVAMGAMNVPVVDIVDVIGVREGDVPASFAVDVRMIGVLSMRRSSHGALRIGHSKAVHVAICAYIRCNRWSTLRVCRHCARVRSPSVILLGPASCFPAGPKATIEDDRRAPAQRRNNAPRSPSILQPGLLVRPTGHADDAEYVRNHRLCEKPDGTAPDSMFAGARIRRQAGTSSPDRCLYALYYRYLALVDDIGRIRTRHVSTTSPDVRCRSA